MNPGLSFCDACLVGSCLKHGLAGFRRLQADAAEFAVSVVLQENQRSFLEIRLSTAHSQRASLGDAFNDADRIDSLHFEAVPRFQ